MTRHALLAAALLGACEPPYEDPSIGYDEEAFVDVPGEPMAWTMQDRVYRTADGRIELYFTNPGTTPGGGEDPELDDAVVALVDQATTIDAAWYEFTRGPIVDAMVRATQRQASIRFAGDGDESEDVGYIALEAQGVHLAVRPPRDRIMHDKFLVVDDRFLWTGSTNMSENDILRNNNGSLLIDDPTLAGIYREELAQMHDSLKFGRKKAQLDPNQTFTVSDHEITVHFSPGNPQDAILAALDTADERVFFMIFAFTRTDIADKLIALHQSGVEVVGIFDESQAAGRYSVDEKLARAGVPVYIDGNGNSSGFAGGKLHHKTVIIDPLSQSNPTVTVGSYNWSEGASEYNDENMLVLRGDELPAAYADQFCAILAVATPHPEYTGEIPDPCAALMVKVRINEFLANPDGTDDGKEFVEIVNVGGAPVSLAGWKLGDAAVEARHVFGDVTLAPGEAIVVADGATTAPRFEIASTGSLGLANNADEIALRDATGVVVDRVAYTSPTSGVSFNRDPDWSGEGTFGLHPVGDMSPGTRADGSAAAKTVILNEVMANAAGTEATNEFVELVNTSHLAVDVAGWTLWDETTTTPRHTFASPTVIGPGQHLLIWGGGTHAEPGLVLTVSGGLSLNNTGTIASPAAVTLRRGALVTDPIADQHTWTTSADGISVNRQADGSTSAAWVAHNSMPEAAVPESTPRMASPGTRADGTAFGGRVMINEVLADPAGTDAGNEWVELVNVSNLPADISGWMLGDAVNPSRHVFAAGTVLQPGDAIVLFDSGTHPEVPGSIVSSTGSLALNNTAELVTLNDTAGHQRDAVTWKAATSGVSLNRSTDLDPNAPLVNHTTIAGAVGSTSPGLRVDQTDF